MIYRLFRKDLSMRTPQLVLCTPELSESHFIEEISRLIKLVKRKEDLYLRVFDQSEKQPQPNYQDPYNFIKEYEGYVEEGRSIEGVIDTFKRESFFASKTYLYTSFLRIREILDLQKQRFKVEGRATLERLYEECKQHLTEIYNNLAYQEKYELTDIIKFINRSQNARISAFFPKKRDTGLSPIHRSRKLLDRLKEPATNHSLLRKTVSVELVKGREQNKLEEAINKKLVVRQLATEKRMQQRRIPKPKTVNLFKLYDVLEIRQLPADRTGSFKEDLEQDMIDRNQPIRQELKRWEKKYLLFKYCKRERK